MTPEEELRYDIEQYLEEHSISELLELLSYILKDK